MLDEHLHLFQLGGHAGRLDGGRLFFGSQEIPIRDGIPRFTPDLSYSTGNFSRLREKHQTLQLDSRNGTTDRYDTFLERTRWPSNYLAGKTVLECGCGAGPDTEILRGLGATVISVDIAGLDIAQQNVGATGKGIFVQASIMDLPFHERSFDIVFCHRVLQHTPDPRRTLDHILRFVRPGGDAFVHSYARNWRQMLRWKYALLPLTRRVDPERLYGMIERSAPFLFAASSLINKLPGGRYVNHVFVPFRNYRHVPRFRSLSDDRIIEYGVHDTFDALSPPYDSPISAKDMREIAARHLDRAFEVAEYTQITLLRTKVLDTYPERRGANGQPAESQRVG